MSYKLSKFMINRLKKELFYDDDMFIKDCKTYIQALRAGRVIYTVTHVSQSGISRDINIKAFIGKYSKGCYINFNMMLKILGYKFSNNDIKVGGCGMDMLFATNYDIVHTFRRMGLITTKTCNILSQKI